MSKIKEIQKNRKWGYAKYKSLNSPVMNAFFEMDEATYKDGALPKMTKELIAVAISILINCESCMEWHIREAAKGGATQEQVWEALEVAIEMGGGPATTFARFALEVMEDVFEKK